jgi:DNA-binding CsgD family transcriptional regulator
MARAEEQPQLDLVPDRGPVDDDVERDLLRARALVERAMFKHRRRSAGDSIVELSPDEATIRATVSRMLATAREDLYWIAPMRRLQTALGGALPKLGGLAIRGIQVRLLCSEDNLLCPEGMRFLDTAWTHGIQVRVADSPLHELVLADERMALVRWDVGETGEQAIAAQGHAILRALYAVFTWVWDSAVPAVDYRRLGTRAQDGLTQQILVLLNAGYKDDAAARHLGLSVRTYRRHVAELMRDLGAASRFQAGARAAELGLQPARALNHRGGRHDLRLC